MKIKNSKKSENESAIFTDKNYFTKRKDCDIIVLR